MDLDHPKNVRSGTDRNASKISGSALWLSISDFSFLIASIALGHKKAMLQKFAVRKELVQKGTDKRLQTAREKVTSGYMGISA